MAEKKSTAGRPTIAIVGGDTLLAREMGELLNDWKPAPRVQLISAAADGAVEIAKAEDEAIVMIPLASESLEGAGVAFLVGSPASSRRTLKLKPKDGPVLIDLTGALEDNPLARLRAPSAEPNSAPSSVLSRIQVIAHPASIAIAMLLSKIAARTAIRRSIIHVFEPATERGQRGLDELQQQTVAVLSFKKLNKDVFDAQLAFNLLAQYGEEPLESLDSIAQRLERHLASLLSAYPAIPMPSLRVLQAPVFHGHSFSIWIEFEENPGAEILSQWLGEADVDVRPDEPPNNAGIAGISGLSVGAISQDHNQPRATWIWMVADNLRLASENALAVAQEML